MKSFFLISLGVVEFQILYLKKIPDFNFTKSQFYQTKIYANTQNEQCAAPFLSPLPLFFKMRVKDFYKQWRELYKKHGHKKGISSLIKPYKIKAL